MPTNAKWYKLYQDNGDFRLWFDNLARGSPTTAIESARVLHISLGIIKQDLDQLTNLI